MTHVHPQLQLGTTVMSLQDNTRRTLTRQSTLVASKRQGRLQPRWRVSHLYTECRGLLSWTIKLARGFCRLKGQVKGCSTSTAVRHMILQIPARCSRCQTPQPSSTKNLSLDVMCCVLITHITGGARSGGEGSDVWHPDSLSPTSRLCTTHARAHHHHMLAQP